MGNHSSQRIRHKQKYSLDIYQSQKERKVIQWRSNPTINQFIPKVFLQYHDQQQQVNILNNCKINQNLPIEVRFQTFIGNLTILKGKLRFQESLYVLKSLLAGYQVILSYFGKLVVKPYYCFVTKEGEVKAWINSDFRKNTFESQDKKDLGSVTEGQKLFLQPQEWIDQNKLTSSTANIINSILKMVEDFNFDNKEIKGFMRIIDAFILENILKNYDFDRISRFINKFIHQKKLFVKSNLIDAITRIYQDHQSRQLGIGIQTESHEDRQFFNTLPQNKEHIRENIETQSESIKEMKLRKCFSGRQSSGRSFTYNGPHFAKKSTFFELTQNSNGNTKFSTTSNSHIDNLKDHVSSSKCSSRQGVYSQFQTKSSQRKNFISPQFSYNHFTNTNNPSTVDKKIIAFVSTPKSSCVPINDYVINKIQFCKSNEASLKIITESKQTINQIKNLKQNKQSLIAQTSKNIQNFNVPMNHSSQNLQNKVRFSNHIESNKENSENVRKSTEADFSFTPKNQPKVFNSNFFESIQNLNIRKSQFVSPQKNSYLRKNSIIKKSSQDFNNFTMKTIKKLISSNGQISNQQQSQGDFPSNQNISSYSGILASMGRSAQLVQVPSLKGIGFKNDKKLKTMMFTSSNPPNFNPFKSTNMFETH